MNSKTYQEEVEKRGGVDAVAKLFNCGRDRILRRCNGASKVSREEEAAIQSLPVLEDWQTLSKLKREPKFRRKFHARANKLPEGPEKDAAFRLLADTFNGFRALQGGLKKAKNRAKNGE